MANVVVYGRGEKPVIAALVQGAAIAGLRPVLQRPHLDVAGRLPEAVAVFIDGIRGTTHALLHAYIAKGIPVYIIELPRLRAALGADRNAYGDTFGIYRDSLAELPLRVGNRVVVEGVIEDREPLHILVCGQKPGDTSHGMDFNQIGSWARDTIALVKMQYGLPVVYRPHPMTPQGVPEDMYGADLLSLPTVPLRTVLRSAAAVVSYNSTCGIDAIDAGVPAFYCAPAANVSYSDYAQRLGLPPRVLTPGERRTFLMRCGATQWTFDQIADGSMMRAVVLGGSMPAPELVDPTLPAKAVEKPKPLTGAARARAMSREVIADGR